MDSIDGLHAGEVPFDLLKVILFHFRRLFCLFMLGSASLMSMRCQDDALTRARDELREAVLAENTLKVNALKELTIASGLLAFQLEGPVFDVTDAPGA